ncbi:MAG: tRNA preQ1(34) S-adenosylmethionine ribosyltransferase-isomerase QueA [SAR324 cluster bacterium]|nr:tRNA preQ1(34) S-adenosylmethionine ribosyltransferase-isomerase QueA [SAR324 cluster bacterium]
MSFSESASNPDWNLESYHFDLPPDLIAQHPTPLRDHSRMMVLPRDNFNIDHFCFYQIVDLLPDNVALVINNTRVLPARLIGHRVTGGGIEALLVKERSTGEWETKVKRAKRIKRGERLSFCSDHIHALAVERLDDGGWLMKFEDSENLLEKLQQYAESPLPPYITRAQEVEASRIQDNERYQTCYAKKLGAIAAPTAGFHFTPEILNRLKQKGVPIIEITLHVGLGTFAAIRNQDIRRHQIHSEYFEVSPDNLKLLHLARKEKRRLIAVGTTSVRVLETLAKTESGTSGWTDIYIYPPYEFQWVQGLLTNFHLPGSTLILLVAAFYGRENLLQAYRTAVEDKYRFYSYGDCMLIL